MFAKALEKQPLKDLLLEKPLQLFPTMDDREAWDKVDGAEIMAQAEKYRAQPYPPRKATDFMAFVRTGSRKADENPYFFRRRKLTMAALNCCVTGSLEDLDDVVDGLWCICEETSWVISAHNRNDIPGGRRPEEYPLPDPDDPYVDLFSAQTAMILSLICSVMPRQLDDVTPMLRQRVQREIRQRVLEPFMTHDDFWWMGITRRKLNNWTPWIVSNVQLTAALCMEDRTALAALLERSLLMEDCWLACVPEDGGCDEGAAYWNVAGGSLLDSLDLLEQLTAGRMTFWDVPKVRNIMQFPAKAALDNGWFLNYADCDARPLVCGERLQFAGEKLQDCELLGLGVKMRGDYAAQIDDTPHMWRVLNMLFHPVCTLENWQRSPKDEWLPDLQLRIHEEDGFLMCCKGGHNDESHNHNDVGSFMLYVDGRPLFVDAGNMVYTAKTFSAERYTLWNIRSAYHNVPMIGGQEQMPGLEHAARDVQPTENGLQLDMAGAYGSEAGVVSAKRHIRVQEGALHLQDELTLQQPQDACWVFMLREEPTLEPGTACFTGVRMLFDPQLTAAVEEIQVTDPRMAGNYPGSLWRLTLTAEPSARHEQQFRVERR